MSTQKRKKAKKGFHPPGGGGFIFHPKGGRVRRKSRGGPKAITPST